MQVDFIITETPIAIPPEVNAGVMRAELLGADGTTVEQAGDNVTKFSNVSAGAKTLRLSRLDTNGNLIGAIFTQGFTVDQDPPMPVHTVGVPTGVSITVSADVPAA